jgi:O-antigen/teichoic acid export membrane protein
MINPTAPDTTEDLEEAISDIEVQDIKTKTVTGAISYFIRTGILQGIGLASAFFLSAFFAPEDFGVYGFVTQIIGLLVFLSDIGLAAALIQKKTEPKTKDYQTAFTVQQILSWFIVAVALAIIATGYVEQQVGSEGKWILLALAISFPLASIKTVSSIKLQRELEFSKLIFPQILEQLTFHGILVFMAWRGVGVMAYAWAILARSIIGTIAMLLIKPWKIGVRIDKVSLKEMIGFGAKFQLNDFLARIKDQLFYLALGSYLPLRDFGYIQWAKTWSMYPYNLTVQNVMSITFPTFARLQKRKDLLKAAIEKSIYFISLLIFPILAGMIVMISPLTQVIPQYAKWQPAIPSFIMFALSIGWAAISTPLVNTLNAIGKINRSLKLMVIWTVLTWGLTPLLLWQFGTNGVALAALVISFTSVLAIRFVKDYVEVNVWTQIWRQLLAASFMILLGWFLIDFMSRGMKHLLTGGVLIGIVYLAGLAVFGFQKLQNEIKSLT